MILTLSGKITHKSADFVVVEAGGVGYQVFANGRALHELQAGAAVKFWTHEHLREDSRELYGFLTQPELWLFKKLVDISGVGPKMALHVLDLGSVKEIEALIERGDADTLSRVPRVGRKTAQKIILELKGKLVEPSAGGQADDEVLNALLDMGYNRDQAKRALEAVGTKEMSVEARLKAALRNLAR